MDIPGVAASMAADERVAAETKAVLDAGISMYATAAESGIPLRFIGSLAIQMMCPDFRHLAVALERRPSQDVDFMAYSRDERAINGLFAQLGHLLHPGVKHSREFGVKRLIFVAPDDGPKVDIFLDDLVMAHTVPFKGRLELSDPTVTVVDLLLSKLQIHEMTRNDQIDLIIVLNEHASEREGGLLDAGYLAQLLARDWGFFHSATSNLDSLKASLHEFIGLPAECAQRVTQRADQLLALLDSTSKSSKWKMRARVGPRVRWYEDVQEVT